MVKICAEIRGKCTFVEIGGAYTYTKGGESEFHTGKGSAANARIRECDRPATESIISPGANPSLFTATKHTASQVNSCVSERKRDENLLCVFRAGWRK
jgi:hypothetical protein